MWPGEGGSRDCLGSETSRETPTPSLGPHLLPYIWGGWKPHKIEQALLEGSGTFWKKGQGTGLLEGLARASDRTFP